MKNTYLAVILLLGLLACKKEEVKFYDGGDRVQFARQSTNTTVAYAENQDYSFAGKGARMADTLYIPIDVTGRVADFQREAKVELIVGETTAVEGTDFQFGRHWIPEKQSKGFVMLILKKTPELSTLVKTVAFRIVASADFKPGIEKQLKSRVNFFNFMVKPTNWDTMISRYFGAYSKVKHEFVLYQLGYPEINLAVGVPEDPSKYLFSGTKFTQFQNKLRSLLADLNSGTLKPGPNDPFTYPLKDENGLAIVFP